jgi:hypothetical protein
MTAFRDFGTEGLAADEFTAAKQLIACNWVQAMEPTLDSAHISHLHQFAGIDDIPDDGSDQPGYPSNAMAWKICRHDRAPRIQLQETWYGYRYAGIRKTPHGNTHVQVTAWAVPYSTMDAAIPFSVGHTMYVPIDDRHCWRYRVAPRRQLNPRGLGGASRFAAVPYRSPFTSLADGIIPRLFTLENDYLINRDDQWSGIFSGVRDYDSQDFMVTESMGPAYDRTKEHLGSTDRAISRMWRMLISAAQRLAAGGEPPAVGDLDYEAIRGAEKILEPGEDWRNLGTDDDPVVREAYCID